MTTSNSLKSTVKRILVEKKQGFDLEAKHLKCEIEESLHIDGIKSLRLLNRYDIEGIEESVYEKAVRNIFSEPIQIMYIKRK